MNLECNNGQAAVTIRKRQGLFLIFIMTLLFLAACAVTTPPTAPPITAVTALTLAAPAVIKAGAAVTVVVTTDSPDSTQPVRLTLVDAYGAKILQDQLTNGAATFSLPPALVQTAGQMRLLAQVAAVQGSGVMVIEPGTPVAPILTLVGPRSITADGKQWAMVVAVPQDAYANPVADKTPVIVRTLHPARTLTSTSADNRDVETQTTATAHLIAWQRIYSRTKAGRMSMAVNAGGAHSPERIVLAVPGAPIPFALTADPIRLIADGQQLVTVRTEPIVDAFANRLLDGTSITFLVEEGNGAIRSLPGQIIAGAATTQVQAPAAPGRLTIRAFVLDTQSQPLALSFAAGLAVAPFSVTVTVTAEEVVLAAGPFVGQLGQYIPDGSMATFQLTPIVATSPTQGASKLGQVAVAKEALWTLTAQSDAGFATGRIRRVELPPGAYQVDVTLGAATVGVGSGQTTFILPEAP